MTEILTPDPAGIAHAAALLRAGALVAFGTETVYGLGADATQGRAVAAIFAAKGRPRFNPLISHVASAGAAFTHVHATPAAQQLADRFWPGPLTLVLPRRADSAIDLLAGAGLDTLAVRVPAHPAALALLTATDRPLAAPSANRSGGVSPTSAAHVLADLDGSIDAILDCGPTVIGLESTVIDLTGDRPSLLRPGGTPAEAVEMVIGPLERPSDSAAADPTAPRSPGLLASHYAPELPMRLNALSAAPDEALLAFGPAPPAALTWNLSEARDLEEAASRLFAGLRWLDAESVSRKLSRIAVMEVPRSGLGEAIRDRLSRAAAPRS